MIETLFLLRLVPYGFAAFLSFKKGYPLLGSAIVYTMFLVILNFVFTVDPEIRSALASFVPILLLLHIARLLPRR